MRLWLGIGALVLCVVALTLVYTSAEKKRNEEAFHTTLSSFQTALVTGTNRTQVEDYLRQHGISFTNGPQNTYVRVDLGQEPRNLFCQPWNVYADFQFKEPNAANPGSDRLTSIDLHREGICF
jgi:hypothetical protein